jgi:hypothetical protein
MATTYRADKQSFSHHPLTLSDPAASHTGNKAQDNRRLTHSLASPAADRPERPPSSEKQQANGKIPHDELRNMSLANAFLVESLL